MMMSKETASVTASLMMNPMMSPVTTYNVDPTAKGNHEDNELFTNSSLATVTGEKTRRPISIMPLIDKKEKPIAFVVWGHFLATISSLGLIIMGLISAEWAKSPDLERVAQYGSQSFGYGSVAVGVLVFVYEHKLGVMVAKDRMGFGSGLDPRGLLYVLAGIPALLTIPTFMPGVGLFVAGLAIMNGARLKEVNTRPLRRKQKKKKDEEFITGNTFKKLGPFKWLGYKGKKIKENGEEGEYIILAIYWGLNFYLFFDYLSLWQDIVGKAQLASPNTAPTSWVPWAKAFGQLLNFNCALIVLPVLRSFLRIINNNSIQR